MRRLRILALLTTVLLAVPGFGTARAELPEMQIGISGDEVLPGSASVIMMTVPEDGTCSIRILDADGERIAVVAEDRPVSAGYNAMYWNGTYDGIAVPEGQWRLEVEMNGRTAETPVTVGKMVPCLISASISDATVIPGKQVAAAWCATEAGDVLIHLESGGEVKAAFRFPAQAGDGTAVFEAAVPCGSYRAVMVLARADGTTSAPAEMPLDVVPPETKFSPVYTSPYTGRDVRLNAWTVPMDIGDETAVWQALTAPVTVVDDGKSTDQRRQIIVRSEPSEDSEGIGMVTLFSQGVHVLERGGEWSLIECYSSSFHNSAILNWNALIQGYIPTKFLREVIPNQEMGLVVDKLAQQMYIFLDGELYSTLLVSTGLLNAKQPYNETRSGEYLLVSRVGGFESDNLYCPMAIRFNAGDMIHEVPYSKRYVDYSSTEPKLGTKASHGCIRVQRKASPEGVNMQWVWNHYKANTKILIWEDWQGRQLPVPADDTVLYTNLRKNNLYHSSSSCGELGTRRPETVTYAELCGEKGKKLKACPACAPALKRSELEEINTLYAPGGDHDPGMTEARTDCPRKIR